MEAAVWPSGEGAAGSADAGAAIECRGLVKHFGTVKAVDGLDMEVPAGSVYGFLGPNGAGKTTTIRADFLSGSADSDDTTAWFLDSERKELIGLDLEKKSPQTHTLELTAKDVGVDGKNVLLL